MSAFGDWLGNLKGIWSPQTNGVVGTLQGISNAIAPTQYHPLTTDSPQQQANNLQALTTPQSSPTYTGGGGGGGGTGYQDLAPYQQQVQGDQNSINNLYSQLFGGVDRQVADQTGQLQNQYNQQFDNADKAFANTQATTNNMMYGRGAGDSSYNAAAQGQNQDIYNQDHSNLVNAENQGLAKLGQFAQTTKNSLTNSKNADQYDLSQYTDVPSLQALHAQLGQHITGLQQQLSGLGTNQDFLNVLNQITPVQSQASTQLSQKLANLVNTSASPEAKDALAQGYISEAQLTDPNAQKYWIGYFNDLNKKAQQAPTPLAPTVG